MFDVNRDEKIYWPDFMKGLTQCMFGDESELDGFIFHFFSLNEYVLSVLLPSVASTSSLKNFNP